MSKYREAVQAHRSPTSATPLFGEEDRKNFPEVIALLGGEKNEAGQWDPSPCTISLFVNENRLTACIKPKHDHLIAFTTIGDSAALLEALERIFCKADLEWKVPSKRK